MVPVLGYMKSYVLMLSRVGHHDTCLMWVRLNVTPAWLFHFPGHPTSLLQGFVGFVCDVVVRDSPAFRIIVSLHHVAFAHAGTRMFWQRLFGWGVFLSRPRSVMIMRVCCSCCIIIIKIKLYIYSPLRFDGRGGRRRSGGVNLPVWFYCLVKRVIDY